MQQIRDAIDKSSSILVTFRKKFDVDTVASACALSWYLKKQSKNVDIICDGFHLPSNLSFLPEIQHISPTFSDLQKLTISIDVKNQEVDQLSYDVKDGMLSIHIAPKRGVIRKENVSADISPYKYDLIITADTNDLESLGDLYEENTQLFQEKPIINIDHHASNETFGHIHYLDVTASSTCELVLRLIREDKQFVLDETISLILLTGIIAKTKSFTVPNISPKTFLSVKTLIESGADRNLIIKNLYRNKALETINLWGRVLARLKHDHEIKLGWSMVPEYDFVDTSTSESSLEGVVEEFIRDLPNIETFCLFYQRGKNIHIEVFSMNTHDAMELTGSFRSRGTRHHSSFTLHETNLADAEKRVIEELRRIMKKHSS